MGVRYDSPLIEEGSGISLLGPPHPVLRPTDPSGVLLSFRRPDRSPDCVEALCFYSPLSPERVLLLRPCCRRGDRGSQKL